MRLLNIPSTAIVVIHEVRYVQMIGNSSFKIGDIVIDRLDGCHGVVDSINPNGTLNVRDKWVVEGLISPSRLIKLLPILQ